MGNFLPYVARRQKDPDKKKLPSSGKEGIWLHFSSLRASLGGGGQRYPENWAGEKGLRQLPTSS
ncbi:hypothetical protein EK904_003555 [Melospiza melodia maxima]|nr:hypothetical protein EK904_003555 [Melospiza melodia maxima]